MIGILFGGFDSVKQWFSLQTFYSCAWFQSTRPIKATIHVFSLLRFVLKFHSFFCYCQVTKKSQIVGGWNGCSPLITCTWKSAAEILPPRHMAVLVTPRDASLSLAQHRLTGRCPMFSEWFALVVWGYKSTLLINSQLSAYSLRSSLVVYLPQSVDL